MHWLWMSLFHAAAMGWNLLWALVLGFTLSGMLQVFVSKEQMSRSFGETNLRSMMLATLLGGASSSCSYAAAATGRSALQKGAAFLPMLAFMFASTNLVVELGAVLWLVMGWRFVLAEVVGSFVLIGFVWVLGRLIFPEDIGKEAREHAEKSGGGEEGCGHEGHAHHHSHGNGENSGEADEPFGEKVRLAKNWAKVADSFFMDWQMLWKEIAIGFLIGGFLATLVPDAWWKAVFLTSAPGPLRLVENLVVGPIIAGLSFVCSIGNVPVASLLWSGGISFGGVIAFLYGDLLVVPLVAAYRKYYGSRVAFYMTLGFFLSMVGAGLVVDLLFHAVGWVPAGPRPPSAILHAGFSWNYTTWLNLAALALSGVFVFLRLRRPEANEHGS